VAITGLLLAGAAWADNRPLLTIVDGEARVTDGTRHLEATEGQRLSPGALIDTGRRAGLVRIEWPDGQTVDLGPDTHLMLSPAAVAPNPKAVYLLSGWAKLSSGATQPVGGLVTPGADLSGFKGVAVVLVAPGESLVFAESGALQMRERGGAKAGPAQALKAGEAYLRAGSSAPSVTQRPPPELLKRIPRGFRDTLPLLAPKFKDKDVNAPPLPLPSYTELAPWLTAEVPLRREFPRRFAARAQEAPFRAELVAHLASHPEWEPVLYPPPPKPASAPR
jgi:hypothetical protein